MWQGAGGLARRLSAAEGLREDVQSSVELQDILDEVSKVDK